MKKLAMTIAASVALLGAAFADGVKTAPELPAAQKTVAVKTATAKTVAAKPAPAKPLRVASLKSNSAKGVEGAKLDPITTSKLEALINTNRLISRTIEEREDGQYSIETYRQAGVVTVVTNKLTAVATSRHPYKYSTLKLLTAIADSGKYAEIKEALTSQTLPNGMPYWDAILLAQYLMEDDPRLQSGCQLAVQSGLCTQEQLDAVLEAARE